MKPYRKISFFVLLVLLLNAALPVQVGRASGTFLEGASPISVPWTP